MRNALAILLAAGLGAASCTPQGQSEYAGVYGQGDRTLVVATGSPGELGLLEALAGEFSRQAGVKVLWRKAGTGESLQLLRDGKADVVMVHAPAAAEQAAVREGWATRRMLIGSNEFFLVGPAGDPAVASKAGAIVRAYRRIAESRSPFLTRADNSGTHIKELAIWKKAGVTPGGSWYLPTRDFMMASLLRADAEGCYFMTDSSTWFVGRSRVPNLKVFVRDDPLLVNVYHALCRPGSGAAVAFMDFLASPKAQQIFRDYGKDKFGEPLYRDALHSREND
ncbi:MAG: substrate-binding domain-containing protein [Planctomycetota bacterium]|nr:substrate-binding domain-containing protein [Planctomycetota bacterium]